MVYEKLYENMVVAVDSGFFLEVNPTLESTAFLKARIKFHKKNIEVKGVKANKKLNGYKSAFKFISINSSDALYNIIKWYPKLSENGLITVKDFKDWPFDRFIELHGYFIHKKNMDYRLFLIKDRGYRICFGARKEYIKFPMVYDSAGLANLACLTNFGRESNGY